MLDVGGTVAKIQPPSLRPDTVERPRLLGWLRARSRDRVILVLADAGYGKTTLLADFDRRVRSRTLWYRFDHADRDWATVIHHLIAAGRRHDQDFAKGTEALLTPVGSEHRSRDEVLEAFVAELSSLVRSHTILFLDDFHEVDDAPDVRHVFRHLISRAPQDLTFVIASRRVPSLPLAKLRAAGEVGELGTAELRFDLDETEQLFNVAYGRNLERDVLLDLARRTEGWAASLQMVDAALRDRSPAEIRRFVRSLSGADHQLYDYLAEVVVGDLSEELQQFLMTTSILQEVTTDLAEVVTGLGESTVTQLLLVAERLTLLTRATARAGRRYHPLVREFLEARLIARDGDVAVAALHRKVAQAARDHDWRTSAFHFSAAGDADEMMEVVGGAIPTIMGNGQYELAESFLQMIEPVGRPSRFDVIMSRVDMQQGDYEAAIAASQAVLGTQEIDAVERDHALLNLVTLYLNYGDGEEALKYAELLKASPDVNLAMIAKASMAMVTGSEADDISRIDRLLSSMARAQRASRPHHYAVTQYNLASNYLVQDRPDRALAEVSSALEILESGSASIELAAARLLRAQALGMLGQIQDAQAALDAISGADLAAHLEDEIVVGIGDLHDSYLDPEAAQSALAALDLKHSATPSGRRLAVLAIARMLIRRKRFEAAAEALAMYPPGRPAHLGIEAARRATHAYLAVASDATDSSELAREAIRHAQAQGAHRWRRASELLLSAVDGPGRLSSEVARVGRESPHTLTYVADVIGQRLHELDEQALVAIRGAAALHPMRWRFVLRDLIDSRGPAAFHGALVLEEIGEKEDVGRLRGLSHELRKRPEAASIGRALARRLADPVYVEDLGRVRFRIGTRAVPGSDVRRKVLALACFLISRPQLSATRDQVLDALWPDLDPEVAANSLNQTLYFLRRVIEEKYREDLSPGYVHHDSDVIWLDASLVTSRSVECRRLIRELPSEPDPDQVERLVELYQGRFALDFEYEEWATAYRDTLHASYLEIVERSVLVDFERGHHDRGISVARRALEVESSAENIEVSLVRLYRVTGAHTAAAERYAHYASVVRDELGIEPPPLESL